MRRFTAAGAPIFLAAIGVLAACAGGTETQGTGGTTSSSASSSSGASSSSSGTGGAMASSSSSSSASSSGTGGTGGTGGGVGCHWKYGVASCGPGMYCHAPDCGDGTCMPLGTTEEATRAPVCGCDGVTYWNATVAASHGMPLQATGVCQPEKTCGGIANLKCPMGASCNRHVADALACGASDSAGTCWAAPAACTTMVGFGPQTRACGSPSCAGECDLIKTEQPWYDDNTCPQ